MVRRIVNVVVRCCLANASVYIMINGSGALANNYTDTLSSLYLVKHENRKKLQYIKKDCKNIEK